jgi:heat shock protein HtpX
MSSGRVVTAYVLFVVLSALIPGMIVHHPAAFALGGGVAVVWWIVASMVGERILIWSMGAAELNVGRYPEIGKLVTSKHIGMGMGPPSLYMINNTSPMIMSIGLSPRRSSLVLTKGLLERLDDKVQLGVVVREVEAIRSGLTEANTAAATLLWLILLPGKIGTMIAKRQPGEPNPLGIILNLVPAFVGFFFAIITADKVKMYSADLGALKWVDNPKYLPYALMKLQDMLLASPFDCELPLTACCIINPNSRDPLSALFKTHPPTPKRIERLRLRATGNRRR